MIQCVGRTPESFTVDSDGPVHELLPDPQDGWRWWWQHHELAAEIEVQRDHRAVTWKHVAEEMGIGVARSGAWTSCGTARPSA